MSLKIQVNSEDDLSGTWSDIETLTLSPGVLRTIGILESAGRIRDARLWPAGANNQMAASVANRHGAEAIAEGWVEVSPQGAGTWQVTTFPTAFPILFDDLGATQGVYVFAIAASARTLLDIRLVVPDGADTAGALDLQLTLRCVDD